MTDFIIYSDDKPNSLSIRQANRDAHLAWLKAPATVTLLTAGPWLDDAGEMRGSLLIVAAENQKVVENWLAEDPYLAAGLTKSAMIKPFKWVIGRPNSEGT